MPEIIRAESLWKSAADEDNRGRAWKGKGRTAIQKRVYKYLWRFARRSTVFGSGYHMRDGQIRYLKAARATEYVTCTAKVVKPGRNITVVSFEIMDSNGMLLNTGDFTFYNLKEKEIL